MWAIILLAMILYLCALMLVQMVAEHKRNTMELPPEVELFWGSLGKAIFTLFKSITGGLSWEVCADALAEVGWSHVAIYVLFIIFTVLALLNIINGVFCASAMESAELNRDLAVQKHVGLHREYTQKVRELFKEIDKDDSGVITLYEFEQKMHDEDCVAFMATLDIEADVAWDLFKLIDADQSGSIDIDEFVKSCLRLRGAAKSLDIARLEDKIVRFDKVLAKIATDMTASKTLFEGNLARRYGSQRHIAPVIEAISLSQERNRLPQQSSSIEEEPTRSCWNDRT